MTSRQSMRIQSLDHIQLAMPAGAEALARLFYGTLLGIPEALKAAHLAPRGGCWFERGNRIELMEPHGLIEPIDNDG